MTAGGGAAEVERQRVPHLLDQHAVGLAVLGLQAARALEVPLPGHGLAHQGGRRAGCKDVAPPRAEAAVADRRQVVGAVDDHHGRERPLGLDPDAAHRGVPAVAPARPQSQPGAGHDPFPARQDDLVEQRARAAAQPEHGGARVHHHLSALAGEPQRRRRGRVGSGGAVRHQAVDGAAVRRDRGGEGHQEPLDGRRVSSLPAFQRASTWSSAGTGRPAGIDHGRASADRALRASAAAAPRRRISPVRATPAVSLHRQRDPAGNAFCGCGGENRPGRWREKSLARRSRRRQSGPLGPPVRSGAGEGEPEQGEERNRVDLHKEQVSSANSGPGLAGG